jgi:hypothetical protein
MDGHPSAGLPTGIKRNDSQQCNRLHHKGGILFFARRGARKIHAARHNAGLPWKKKSPASAGLSVSCGRASDQNGISSSAKSSIGGADCCGCGRGLPPWLP